MMYYAVNYEREWLVAFRTREDRRRFIDLGGDTYGFTKLTMDDARKTVTRFEQFRRCVNLPGTVYNRNCSMVGYLSRGILYWYNRPVEDSLGVLCG